MKRYIFVRHPRPVTAGQPLCIGHTDVEIAVPLVEVVPILERCAEVWGVDRVVSSDLQRCRLPAEELVRNKGLPLEIKPEWREISFGQWEGKNWETIGALKDSKLAAWMKNFLRVKPPGGESFPAFHKRIGGAWEELRKCDAQCVLVMTHGGVIRSVLCHVTGMPARSVFHVEVDYLGMLMVEETHHPRIRFLPPGGLPEKI